MNEKRNEIVVCCKSYAIKMEEEWKQLITKGEQLLSVNFTISNSSERQLGKRLVWPAGPEEEGS